MKQTFKPGKVTVIVSTIIAAFIVLKVFVAIIGSGNSPSSTSSSPSPTAINNQVSDIDKFPALKQLLSGNNNDSPPQPKLRHFEYFPDFGTVNVDFNMNQNIGKDLTVGGIKKEMSDIYIALYHDSNLPVSNVSVSAWGPMQDKYGNTSYVKVVGTRLKKDVADKINWQQDKAMLELQIIPGLWQTFLGNDQLNWKVTETTTVQ